MMNRLIVRPRSLRGVAAVVPVLVGVAVALGACGGDGPSGPESLGVVTDLTATAVDAFQAELTWTDARGESAYDVHRSTQSGFVPGAANRIGNGLPAGTTAFSDDGLVESTAYYYKVVARNATESTVSNQAGVSTPAPQTVTLVADKFDRTVDPGWGTADLGGAWKKADEGPMRVNGSIAMIETWDSIPQINVLEDLSTYGRYVDGKIRFKIGRMPDGAFHAVEFYARRDDDDGTTGENHYRFSVMAHHDGLFDLRIEKEVGGVTEFLTDPVATTLTFEPNAWYWVRWEATGTQPTNLRFRVWRLGEVEPATWNIDIEHSDPRLDVRGTTGVRVHASGEHVNFPVVFSFDDLTLVGD